MTLKMVKIEEGLLDGEIIHHEFVEKTEEQKKEIRETREKRKREKEKRKKEQEKNIRKKQKHHYILTNVFHNRFCFIYRLLSYKRARLRGTSTLLLLYSV